MKKLLMKACLGLSLFVAATAPAFPSHAAEYVQGTGTTEKVATPTTPTLNPSTYFTGKAYVLPLFGEIGSTTYGGTYVTFTPGARSHWYTHSGGQRLLVVKGTLWTQVWNGPKTIAKEGDTVWCPPGIKHWHGAPPNEEVLQLTLTESRNGANVTWLEPVTDAQYNSK